MKHTGNSGFLYTCIFVFDCKNSSNLNLIREFKIQCKGVGVHPPLEMSHQVIHFSATSLYDVSTAYFHVINSHTSTNEFTHPVPRIGKGEIHVVDFSENGEFRFNTLSNSFFDP